MIQRERVTAKFSGANRGAGGNEKAGGGESVDGGKGGSYVLYWMQRSQREGCNHALEYAVERAGELGLPVLVLFVLVPDYPEAVGRHYRFMLEGLSVTARRLKERGIGFIIRKGTPLVEVPRLAEKAALLVGDRSYLRTPRQWRAEVEARIDCPYHEVESDAVVPVETASDKEEYTAGTLRPKIHRRLFHFLVPLQRRKVSVKWSGRFLPAGAEDEEEVWGGFDAGQVDEHLPPGAEEIPQVDKHIPKGVEDLPQSDEHIPRGGEDAAEELLEQFIADKLEGFDSSRNDPSKDYASGLSPYLHFGQISPLTIALAVMEYKELSSEGFLEELVVRRELSFNFTWYNFLYDSLECLPRWALETLKAHEQDMRDPSYSMEVLESGGTEDPYWNAAQKELLLTGKMHGYMRMYWGKKILEWTPAPEEAFRRALYLNNRYALDGRDPNSFAGVAWCFGKHDRAWKERRIFGKVRYMNDRGLERKFRIQNYVERIDTLALGAPTSPGSPLSPFGQ